jgi:hypothetical protein
MSASASWRIRLENDTYVFYFARGGHNIEIFTPPGESDPSRSDYHIRGVTPRIKAWSDDRALDHDHF